MLTRTKYWRIWGNYGRSEGMGKTHLQHLSQKNLSSAFKVSVELKFLRQLVIELFCSMSRLRSKNVSSLSVTVSHLKHLVSLVNIPYISKIKIIGSSPRVKKNIASIGNAHKSMLAQMKGISPGSIYGPM